MSIILGLADGRDFDLDALRKEDWPIEYIAERLSLLNRFGGHTRGRGYSVAAHSVLVSFLAPAWLHMEALMHDMTEAAGLVDVPSPVKHLMPEYIALEARTRRQMGPFFGLAEVEPPEVKPYDDRAWEIEELLLRGRKFGPELSQYERSVGSVCVGMTAREAAGNFVFRYQHLLRVEPPAPRPAHD